MNSKDLIDYVKFFEQDWGILKKLAYKLNNQLRQ